MSTLYAIAHLPFRFICMYLLPFVSVFVGFCLLLPYYYGKLQMWMIALSEGKDGEEAFLLCKRRTYTRLALSAALIALGILYTALVLCVWLPRTHLVLRGFSHMDLYIPFLYVFLWLFYMLLVLISLFPKTDLKNLSLQSINRLLLSRLYTAAEKGDDIRLMCRQKPWKRICLNITAAALFHALVPVFLIHLKTILFF